MKENCLRLWWSAISWLTPDIWRTKMRKKKLCNFRSRVDIRSAWLFLSRLFFLFFLPFSLHTFKWLWKENEIKIGDGKTKEGASAFVLLRDINKKKSRHMCLVYTYNCSTFHAPLLSIAGPAGADSETQKRTLIIITGYRVPPPTVRGANTFLPLTYTFSQCGSKMIWERRRRRKKSEWCGICIPWPDCLFFFRCYCCAPHQPIIEWKCQSYIL